MLDKILALLTVAIVFVMPLSAHADSQEILRETYNQTVQQAMVSENVEGIVASYADNGRVMPEYQETGVGIDGVSAYYKAYFERFDISSFERTASEVFDMENVVVEIGSFEVEQKHTENETKHHWTGTYYDVWERRENGSFKLYSSSWNYDQNYEGIRELAHFDGVGGVSAISFPGLTVTDDLGYELTALRKFGERIMLRNQPELLFYIYAEDTEYAPHDRPVVKGRAAVVEFFKEYTAHWPAFDYVDVVVHRRDVKNDFVLEHMSYNLRGVGLEQSGVGIGKGVRIWKRSAAGQMQSYRQIAMHDY